MSSPALSRACPFYPETTRSSDVGIPCPECGYDLAAHAADEKCPECGVIFDGEVRGAPRAWLWLLTLLVGMPILYTPTVVALVQFVPMPWPDCPPWWPGRSVIAAAIVLVSLLAALVHARPRRWSMRRAWIVGALVGAVGIAAGYGLVQWWASGS